MEEIGSRHVARGLLAEDAMRSAVVEHGCNRFLAALRKSGQYARAVSEYEVFATSLAFLRHRAERGTAGPDFVAREQELLHHLWQRRDLAGPALTYAARATGRAWQPPPHLDYSGFNPYRG